MWWCWWRVGGVEVDAMESGDDEASDVEMTSLTVRVGSECVPLSDVTDDMVARMTAAEKDEYIRLGQQLYDQFNH